MNFSHFMNFSHSNNSNVIDCVVVLWCVSVVVWCVCVWCVWARRSTGTAQYSQVSGRGP
jgi:hypothetical protein